MSKHFPGPGPYIARIEFECRSETFLVCVQEDNRAFVIDIEGRVVEYENVEDLLEITVESIPLRPRNPATQDLYDKLFEYQRMLG